MSDDKKQSRTKIDFIYKEIIGDIDSMLTRIEAITKELDELKAANTEVKNVLADFPPKLYESLKGSSEVIAKNAAISLGEVLSETENNLKQLSNNSASLASIASRSAKQMALIAISIGASAGLLGGLLVGIALFNIF